MCPEAATRGGPKPLARAAWEEISPTRGKDLARRPDWRSRQLLAGTGVGVIAISIGPAHQKPGVRLNSNSQPLPGRCNGRAMSSWPTANPNRFTRIVIPVLAMGLRFPPKNVGA